MIFILQWKGHEMYLLQFFFPFFSVLLLGLYFANIFLQNIYCCMEGEKNQM